jgi:UDP:flavonoid glycosyltransferase YjiC (YdhE family)
MVTTAIYLKSPGTYIPNCLLVRAHPLEISQATGWFVTHGGFNSVTESLASGIPL